MKRALAAMVVAIAMTSVGVAQDTPPVDRSGKGAVLCIYGIFLEVQAFSAACKWERTPADDAIDKGLVDMETFIRANASTFDPQREIEAFKKQNAKMTGSPDSLSQCKAFDPNDHTSSFAFMWMIHQQDAEQVRASIADTISIPREPLMNPCL